MTAAGDQNQSELLGLRAQWTEAERRLYPLATTATELYMAAVRAVREVADELGSVSEHHELVARWPAAAEVLAAAMERAGVGVPESVPTEQVVGAGFALRDREIAVENEERDRKDRVAAAVASGDQPWVTLHERGDIGRGLADPYQCIEFHLPTALALVSTVEQNPVTAGTNYVTSVVEMDAEGGQVVEIDVAGIDDREADDAAVFDVNRTEMRELVEKRA